MAKSDYDLINARRTYGGFINRFSSIRLCEEFPRIAIANVVSEPPPSQTRASRTINGAGAHKTAEEAFVRAIGEAFERYSGSTFLSDQLIIASANELGASALDLESLPVCSDHELIHPSCPLRNARKDQPIRWIKGISVFDGDTVFLPAVLVFTNIGFHSGAERFCFPISTGCAAYTSYPSALLRSVYEVIERDSLTVLWLQKLPFPRIAVDCTSREFESYWDFYQRASKDLTYYLFDATTDMGVPIVYGLQIAPHSERVHNVVSCATGGSANEAIGKVLRDMASMRLAFQKDLTIPASINDFGSLMDGATYMARQENKAAFNFLTESNETVSLSALQTPAMSDHEALVQIVKTLRQKNLPVYAVDLTTDEAEWAGMRVTKAIIPGLQPLSFRYRAQYKGHPRLYDAPRKMGYRSLQESQLNEWPQPFA